MIKHITLLVFLVGCGAAPEPPGVDCLGYVACDGVAHEYGVQWHDPMTGSVETCWALQTVVGPACPSGTACRVALADGSIMTGVCR